MRGQRSSASSAAIRGSPRTHPLERRNRQTRLRECLQRRLENVARALENGHERIPPESPRSQFAENHGRANGTVFLRRRRHTPRRLRPTKGQRLAPRSKLVKSNTSKRSGG